MRFTCMSFPSLFYHFLDSRQDTDSGYSGVIAKFTRMMPLSELTALLSSLHSGKKLSWESKDGLSYRNSLYLNEFRALETKFLGLDCHPISRRIQLQCI